MRFSRFCLLELLHPDVWTWVPFWKCCLRFLLSVCLWQCLSVSLFLSVCFCLSGCLRPPPPPLSLSLSLSLTLTLSPSLSFHLQVCISLCPSCLAVCLCSRARVSFCLSFCLSVCLPVSLSLSLSLWLPSYKFLFLWIQPVIVFTYFLCYVCSSGLFTRTFTSWHGPSSDLPSRFATVVYLCLSLALSQCLSLLFSL